MSCGVGRLVGIVFGALGGSEVAEGRPSAPSIDDRQATASAGHAIIQLLAGEPGAVCHPLAALDLLAFVFGLDCQRFVASASGGTLCPLFVSESCHQPILARRPPACSNTGPEPAAIARDAAAQLTRRSTGMVRRLVRAQTDRCAAHAPRSAVRVLARDTITTVGPSSPAMRSGVRSVVASTAAEPMWTVYGNLETPPRLRSVCRLVCGGRRSDLRWGCQATRL